jgi:hypothetical protein
MAIPFAEALDAFIQCILQPMKLDSRGHGFPTFDEKLEGGYDSPDSGHALT